MSELKLWCCCWCCESIELKCVLSGTWSIQREIVTLYSCEGGKLFDVFVWLYVISTSYCDESMKLLIRRESLWSITSMRELGLVEFFKCVYDRSKNAWSSWSAVNLLFFFMSWICNALVNKCIHSSWQLSKRRLLQSSWRKSQDHIHFNMILHNFTEEACCVETLQENKGFKYSVLVNIVIEIINYYNLIK